MDELAAPQILLQRIRLSNILSSQHDDDNEHDGDVDGDEDEDECEDEVRMR